MKVKDLQWKRALRTALLVLLLSTVGMTKGYAQTIGNLNYFLEENTLTATVTGHVNGQNATGSLTIPSSVTYTSYEEIDGHSVPVTRTYTVTSIGPHAFYNCSGFTGDLIIPNSVTMIGDYAFYNCSGFTGTLTIPNSVTVIGTYAFGVDIMDNNEYMGFSGELVIPSSVTTIGHCAFEGCRGFTGSLTIPNSVTYIGVRAFVGCSGFNGSLTISNSVTAIKRSAFEGCSGFTGDLIIPNSVTTIDEFAFWNCSGFTGSLTIGNSMTTIGGSAFGDCSGFTGDLIIPNSVTSIGAEAFYNCSGFTGSLTIGNSVTIIDFSPFAYCDFEEIIVDSWNTVYDSRDSCNAIIETNTNTLIRGCKNTIIPNTVTSIGYYAFYGCSDLTYISIPSSVNSIESGAFWDCNNLMSIVMMATTPPQLNEYEYWGFAFPSLNPKFKIYVPWGSVYDYKTAWGNYEPYIKPRHILSVLGYDNEISGGTNNNTSNDKWTFISLPLANETDPATVLNLLSEDGGYDLYQFDQSAEHQEWRNYKVDSFNFVNGRGYLYAKAVDVNLVIGGDFNEDETKEVSLDYDAGKPFAGWNLVGNPFPVGAYINRSYYVMNATGSGIEPMAISSSIPIPVCAGVMVKAETAGESVVFNRTAPSNRIDLGKLQIELTESTPNRDGVSTGSTTVDKAIVSFNAGDALEKYVFNARNAQIYIPQGGKDFAIAYAEKVGEMPLNFKATKNGSYTISVDVENAEMDYLHLIDNLTGADVDLLQMPNYTFTAKTTDYASRFRLMFSVCGDSDGDDAPFAFINNGNIIVLGAEDGSTLQIVDMTGRVVRACTDVACNVSTSGMTPGVYVLRFIDGNDVKTQKIVME